MHDDRLARIEEKLDKQSDRLNSIDVTLSAQHVSLKEHMRRSTANERAVDLLSKQLKPVQTHVAIVNFLVKLSGVILTSEIINAFIKAHK